MLGDSIIDWAGRGQPQLRGGGRIYWNGTSGAQIGDIAKTLSCSLRSRPFPSTLVLHFGTNDIFDTPLHKIRQGIESALESVRNLCPHTRIIWSKILPRSYFHGEKRRGAGGECARNINNHAYATCMGMTNTYVVDHREALPKHITSLYRYDGLHLTHRGIRAFRQHMERALLYFNANPAERHYPRLE